MPGHHGRTDEPAGCPSARPTVGVLSPSTGGYFFGEVLSGVVKAVHESGGGRVVLLQTLDAGGPGDLAPIARASRPPLALDQVDALVTIAWATGGGQLARARDAGIPVVLASNELDDLDAASVVVDNAGGVRMAVEHLVEHGHTAIGFVGHLGQSDVVERFAAYQATMRAHDLEPLPPIETINQVQSGGFAAAEQVVATAAPHWTAVVAATDLVALGLLDGLRELGVRVPEDVAMVGFDDAEAGWYSDPPLTTLRQDFELLGATAGRIALAEAAGQSVLHDRVNVGVTFVQRRSCGCAPERLTVAESAGRDAQALIAEIWPLIGTDPAQASLAAGLDPHAAGAVPGVRPLPEVDLDRLDEAIGATLEQLLVAAPTPETVAGFAQTAVGILSNTGIRLPEGVPGRRTLQYTAARITALLPRAQSEHNRDRVVRLSRMVSRQFDVGMTLLGRTLGDDPTDLRWLSKVGALAGAVGLWANEGQTELRIAGVGDFGDHGLSELVGTTVPIGQFPPDRLLDLAEAADDTVAYVIPMRGPTGDHGLLCVVAPLDREFDTERTTFDHCAALLGAALREQQLLEGLRHSEERYALASRAAADGLWEWDAATGATYLSDRARQLLGVGGESVAETILDAIHPDDRDQVREALLAAVAEPDVPTQVEARVLHPDGAIRWVVVRALGVGGPSGTATGLVGSLSDIDQRKTLEEQLRRAALFDHVTGLPNRRLFLDRLTHALEQPRRRASARFAVLFLDLDGFKLVNDSLGHLMGDELLKVVAERLRSDLRSVDTAARFGGDEFAVLLTDPVPEDLLVVARRIQQRIAEPVRLGDQEVTVTASIGIATSATGYTEAEDVLRDADIAMYRAKESERGTACLFDPDMHEHALDRLRTRTALAQAIEHHEFVVHYQPVVDLANPVVTEFEALVRWQHPERGLIPPGEFLPYLESNQSVVQLGRHVLDQVCADLAVWQRTHPDVTVAVNLSNREFWSPDLRATVAECLDRHEVPASALVLETTESVVMSDPDGAREIMDGLRSMGARVRIDDFGTGHSSMHVLRTFPVDALKLDGSYVAGLGPQGQAKDLVAAILALGRALGIQVHAEWVETPEQAEALRELGCRAGQGWYFARPMPAEQASRLLGTMIGDAARRADTFA